MTDSDRRKELTKRAKMAINRRHYLIAREQYNLLAKFRLRTYNVNEKKNKTKQTHTHAHSLVVFSNRLLDTKINFRVLFLSRISAFMMKNMTTITIAAGKQVRE